MVFRWSLSGSRSHQISRTLLSILAILNNAIILMVSARLPTSKSSNPFNNPLVTVPKALITIGIIVPFMFHCFSSILQQDRYIFLFTFFQFYSVVTRNRKVDNFANSLFLLLIIIRSGHQAKISRSVCTSSPIGVYVCHFLRQVLGRAYTICSYVQI